MKVLAIDAPRGLEQASLVVGGIDHKPAADRLLELLKHPDAEVMITAAWALRRILVPETAKPIFEKVKADTEKSMIPLPLNTAYDMDALNAMYKQHEHLLEALALLRHREAESLLILFFPTPPIRLCPPDIRLDTVWVNPLRLRAIWALGKIFENDPKLNVVQALLERFEQPDSAEVNAGCAITLGRMQAKTVIPRLQKEFKEGNEYSVIAYGAAWGVSRMTGEPIAKFKMTPTILGRGGWFLESLD
jgi:HEAT repeat protein